MRLREWVKDHSRWPIPWLTAVRFAIGDREGLGELPIALELLKEVVTKLNKVEREAQQ